jgi:hypothetical protein
MKYIGFGALGVALALLMAVSLVLSSLFCSIPWTMLSH